MYILVESLELEKGIKYGNVGKVDRKEKSVERQISLTSVSLYCIVSPYGETSLLSEKVSGERYA